MGMSPEARAFTAGLLVSNSAPHLGTAVTGRRHLTPFGRDSGPVVNLVWGLVNLTGGLLLLRTVAQAEGTDQKWYSRLVAFESGCAVFAMWMAVTEKALSVIRARD
ncbi:hypothetical protein F5972_13385 [Microbispora cellulosiformans]|uniref:Uncharacterized protein n=1 Tax=Microbispora cellulosiformans TaxID=2614688 RepID=A0A5J5K490_9ACTN|nr:hypothetical protein [Microbispora cellulosiformans]KAA9379174.1 hypothetical protein F5972_13385 [Microbispora cellulosiformans]